MKHHRYTKHGLLIATLLLVAAGSFFLAGQRNRVLQQQRRVMGITQTDPLKNAPPLIAFTTVALGGFRGLIADALWMRASRLQEEGQFFELIQIANWITQLEPRLGQVWVYQAWNLAYNISVMFPDYSDRWRWVNAAIVLLRNRGLVYNPDDPDMYYELGWLYLHKIGGQFDQAHHYYKQALAHEMAPLLDEGHPRYTLWQKLPSSPEALAAQPEMHRVLSALREANVNPFSPSLLYRQNLTANLAELLSSPAGQQLTAFLQRETFKRTYRMDPTVMERIDTRYGPLDWRLPPAHCLYWTHGGLDYARGDETLMLERMQYQAMSMAFRSGQLYTNEAHDIFLTMPDLTVLPKACRIYEDLIEQYPDNPSLPQVYSFFLKEAIMTLYAYNQTAEAHALFASWKQRYPQDADAHKSFDEFIYTIMNTQKQPSTREQAVALVEGALQQSVFWKQMNKPEQAAGYQRMARLYYDQYMKTSTHPEWIERMGLPPFERLVEQAQAVSVKSTHPQNPKAD